MVLLHGYVGDAASTWGPQLESLADEFTVVAWDAPGAGASSDPPEDVGMAGYADHLAAFIEALRLDRPHVMGVSFGGALAIEHARRHPAGARSMVLVSAYAGWRGSLPAEAAEQRLEQALRLAALPPEQLVDELLPTMFHASIGHEALDEFRRGLLDVHPAGFRAMARAAAEDLRDALPGISHPTLLVYGDQDVRAPPEVGRALHAAIDGSELVVLPGVGHVGNLEAPREFDDAVRPFLRAQSS